MGDVAAERGWRELAIALVADWEISDETCRRVALIMTDDLADGGVGVRREG